MYSMAYTPKFTDWLQSALDERGISQSELARRAGVTRSAINGIIMGTRGPGIELCTGIAHALKLPPEEVLRVAGLLENEPSEDDSLYYRIKNLYHTLRG